MKHLKLYENFKNTDVFFKNEENLKNLLLKDHDFADGEVTLSLANIGLKYDKDNNDNYTDTLNKIKENLGPLPQLALLLCMYDSQVNNGGHRQYYENSYAGRNSKDIDIHEDFVDLFNLLDMVNILPSGKKAFDIIKDFELEFDDEIETCSYCGGSGDEDCRSCSGEGDLDCPECYGSGEIEEGEECSTCSGSGRLACDDCEGSGHEPCENCDGHGELETGVEEPIASYWDILDTKWYKINIDVMKEFNDYLKSLTLDGEKIADLVKYAGPTQKYNL